MVVELRRQVSKWRENNEKIIFVPTMGNLHAGHMALIDYAKSCSGKVICSIFVNALQFDREEDLNAYPRTLQQDLAALQDADVDAVFTPDHDEIYPKQNELAKELPKIPLNQELCGKYRPGFFDGIVEVVTRLFNIVKPDIAVFGEKDYQQLVIIKQLVTELALPIQIKQVVTQREEDGLAFSSRNSYLNVADRKIAPKLYKELMKLKNLIEEGRRDFNALEVKAVNALQEAGFSPDYVAIRNGQDLSKPRYDTDFIAILAAAWLGNARLIDNVLLHAD